MGFSVSFILILPAGSRLYFPEEPLVWRVGDVDQSESLVGRIETFSPSGPPGILKNLHDLSADSIRCFKECDLAQSELCP